MTYKEKVVIFDQCTDRTYHNEIFTPILDDIYNVFDYEFNMFFGFGFKISDTMKIEYVDKLFPFFKRMIDTNNSELFHKILYEVTHPINNHIGSTTMMDLIDLLLYPYEYCNRKEDDSRIMMIIDYLVAEDKYDFYLKNSNYPFLDYVAKLINHTKSNHFRKDSFGVIMIYYFLRYKIDPDKFIPVLDYGMENRMPLGEYITHNFQKEKREEFIKLFGSKVLYEMNLPKKSIK